MGSVPTGQATGTTLDLSLQEAFQRALKYNLGEIESSQNTRAAHAVRLRSLNALLPNLSARLSGTVQQLDLPAEGLTLLKIPGVHIPEVVGPYGIADARAYLSQEIFNWSDIKNLKSASESEKASQYTYKSDRNLVVFTTGNAYLLVISDMATVDSVRAQVTTAQTLVQNDVDLNQHGLIASIDLLRAKVEFQTQQQRLIAAENQVAIDKLTLARVIGLPNGQEFRLTDSVPYAALDGITQEQALQQAYVSETRLSQRQGASARGGIGPAGRCRGKLSFVVNGHELRGHRQSELWHVAWHARFRRHLERSYFPREQGAGG